MSVAVVFSVAGGLTLLLAYVWLHRKPASTYTGQINRWQAGAP